MNRWMRGLPIDILALHDPRFLRMQLETALT